LVPGVLAAVCAVAFLGLAGSASAYTPSGVTSNGFESDTNGWFHLTDEYGNITGGTITQQLGGPGYSNPGGYASGKDAAAGSYFALLNRGPCSTVTNNPAGPAIYCAGPYTDWGNSNGNKWNGPYTTQVDIYLDAGYARAHPDDYAGNLNLVGHSAESDEVGTRFDFTSAINSSAPLDGDGRAQFLRDFGFNVATSNADDQCKGNGFVITGQTVVNRNNANPHLDNYDPQCITESGWYTFKHSFRENATNHNLEVQMDIIPVGGDGTPTASWTIESPDQISDVGCNRYGWFSNQEIYGLPIDNAKITGGCAPSVPQVGKILPTGTTCQQYSAGTAGALDSLLYTAKGNKINSVAPGVFFYYTKITDGKQGQQVDITESNNGGSAAPAIPIQQGQVVIYDMNTCKVLKWATTINSDGTATGTLPSPGNFIIGVKYSATGLQGQTTPSSTVTYSFGAKLAGNPVDAGASINLALKH
jgi:hypothetical protein